MMRLLKLLVVMALGLFGTGYALEFSLPSTGNHVVGRLQRARIGWGDNFHSIGRRFDLGFDEMVAANPEYISKDLPLFYHVLIPSLFILPKAAHKGIVINVAEKRLFYYPSHSNLVFTFPIGLGKVGWSTPLGYMHIVEKIKNPTWYAPKSILQALAAEGYKNVPAVIPPGPNDPLGDYALRLSRRMYLIHGTNDPDSVGTQASSGCIRLFAPDINQLFHLVSKGTSVTIVDQPYELGRRDHSLFLVVYPGLKQKSTFTLNEVETRILQITRHQHWMLNWQTVAYAVLDRTGVPVKIGVHL